MPLSSCSSASHLVSTDAFRCSLQQFNRILSAGSLRGRWVGADAAVAATVAAATSEAGRLWLRTCRWVPTHSVVSLVAESILIS